MNKVFKIKRNHLGQPVVASELAKSFLAVAVVIGGITQASAAVYGDNQISTTKYDPYHVVVVGDKNQVNKEGGNLDNFSIVGNANRVSTISLDSTENVQHSELIFGNNNTVESPNFAETTGSNNVNINSIIIGRNQVIENSSGIIMGDGVKTWYEAKNGTRQSVTSSNSVGVVVLEGSAVNAKYGVSIGSSSQVRAKYGTALGAGAVVVSEADNSVAIGRGSSAREQNVVSFGTGNQALNVEYYGPATRKLVNISKGDVSSTSTDAINGSQLYEVKLVADDALAKATKNATDIQELEANKVDNSDYNVANNIDVEAWKAKLNVPKALMLDEIAENLTDKTATVTVDDTLSVQETPNADKGVTNYHLDLSDATKATLAQVETNKAAIKAVEDKFAAVNDDNKQVIGNTRAIERNIQAVNARVNQHEHRINSLEQGQVRLDNKINNVDSRLRRGIASTTAIAMLGQPTKAGENAVSVAVGHYRDKQALAIGLSKISDNNKWLVKGAVATSTDFGSKNDVSLGGSVTFKW